MRTKPTGSAFTAELPPALSRAELARLIKEAEAMRAEAGAKLFRSAGRRIIRMGRPLAAGATDLARRIRLTWQRERAYRRARAELETYSDRELAADLRLNRSDIPSSPAAEPIDRHRGAMTSTGGLPAAG
jgi:uncharacterized protein YjiS (DUF1127 family)